MKRFLNFLFLQHLRRPKIFWILTGLITVLLGFGVLRVERRLDLMSLLPANNPIVKASIQAGIGQHELMWVVAEGTSDDIGARRNWADGIIENLLDQSGMPLNGITSEGRISPSQPFPANKGLSLWPPLLAAGSLLDGDLDAASLLTEQLYAIAPVLFGNKMKSLQDPAHLREQFAATAKALASPDPIRAKLSQIDPLGLRDLLLSDNQNAQDDTMSGQLSQLAGGFSSLPLKIHTGYLETSDSRYLLLPLVLNFPNGETAATGRLLAWVGNGCVEHPSARVSFKGVNAALAPTEDRPFPVRVTGAHAIAYWESFTLGKEVVISLCLSFILIGIVYWIGFRTLAGYGFVIVPLILAMFWTLGLAGWVLGRLNLMAAAFGAVLLALGDDVGILIFCRYRDERTEGKSKPFALRAALLDTGPGVIAAMFGTTLVFLSCLIAPFPGFRDLGLTAGLGILMCLVSTFLIMPPMLLAFDRGKGVFAPETAEKKLPLGKPSIFKTVLTAGAIIIACIGATKVVWVEDLRSLRQAGNPALALQQELGKALGAGLQPLAIQIPLDEKFPQRWTAVAEILKAENITLPHWSPPDTELGAALSGDEWKAQALKLAESAGLNPSALERPLTSLAASVSDPLNAPRSIMELINPPSDTPGSDTADNSTFSLPIRLPEAAQDTLGSTFKDAGTLMVGTRPLFREVKDVAKSSIKDVIILAVAAMIGIAAVFGRSWLFLGLAIAPMLVGQIGVLGTLGWTGEPLTFLSMIAIPVALGVSVDTVFNLLNRARSDIGAIAKVSRVNAVCAGTTLAGFGGLVFSSYKGLRGLGIAAIGGTALALLTTQWLVPWILKKWPLKK